MVEVKKQPTVKELAAIEAQKHINKASKTVLVTMPNQAAFIYKPKLVSHVIDEKGNVTSKTVESTLNDHPDTYEEFYNNVKDWADANKLSLHEFEVKDIADAKKADAKK